jgi:hypothetical protein
MDTAISLMAWEAAPISLAWLSAAEARSLAVAWVSAAALATCTDRWLMFDTSPRIWSMAKFIESAMAPVKFSVTEA